MDNESAVTGGGWQRVCRIDELTRPGVRTLARPGLNVAVFQVADGRIFGIEDRCPHRGARLSAGLIYDEDKVACADHGWGIRLRDGAVEPPGQGCARVFPVKVEAGWVLVLV